MNWEFGLDLESVAMHVEKAATFSIFFPTLRRSLVIDMRHGPEEGPLVRVLPVARSPHERIRSLRRMRPHLPRATEMVVIPWPTYVENLVRTGVWQKIAQRVTASGSREAARSLTSALAELRKYESLELAALIRGERYETIWSREEK